MSPSGSTADAAGSDPPQIIFLISVDWFFVSHFRHLARAAKADGYDIIVMTRVQRTGKALIDDGFTVIDLPTERHSHGASKLGSAISAVRFELKRRPRAIVHGFGLFGMIVAMLAIGWRRSHRAIYTITGRGYLAADLTRRGLLKRIAVRKLISRVVDHRSVWWIAENNSDIAELGLQRADADRRVTVVGGAGVNPYEFSASPLPPAPPIKCLLVARAIWSKGIDIAVNAIERARASGANIELTIAGGLDPANPRPYSEADMTSFASKPGITWLGHVEDVAALWGDFHVAVLPSRGGEGIPKSLLEAAASGRSVVTTDVPGCREFAVTIGGVVVPQGDIGQLADALASLDLSTLQEQGSKARAVVLQDYTEAAVWRRVGAVYRHASERSDIATG